jgi:hypothetical protein
MEKCIPDPAPVIKALFPLTENGVFAMQAMLIWWRQKKGCLHPWWREHCSINFMSGPVQYQKCGEGYVGRGRG